MGNYFNHNFFKNNYIKEIGILKKSLEKFNNTIKDMINFINKKLEEFNNIINKEIEKIFTDEHNEKIKQLSNLLNEFNFNNNKNKFNEMFTIFNKSIFKSKEIFEYKIDLDKDILYEGKVTKGTNIKNGDGKKDLDILNNKDKNIVKKETNVEKENIECK